MNNANEKMLKRIRALLAMAADTSSPHEAAIAAGRARKLMDEYQVSELDLETTEAAEFGSASFETSYQRLNIPYGYIALAVARLNDCVVGWDRNYGKDIALLTLKFKGFLIDTVTAVEMMKYLVAEMDHQSEIHVPKGTRRLQKMRHAFKLGYGRGVGDQVKLMCDERTRIKTSSGTSLVIVKGQLVTQHFGMQKTSTKGSARASQQANSAQGAYETGKRIGRRVGLDKQVGGSSQKQIGG